MWSNPFGPKQKYIMEYLVILREHLWHAKLKTISYVIHWLILIHTTSVNFLTRLKAFLIKVHINCIKPSEFLWFTNENGKSNVRARKINIKHLLTSIKKDENFPSKAWNKEWPFLSLTFMLYYFQSHIFTYNKGICNKKCWNALNSLKKS